MDQLKQDFLTQDIFPGCDGHVSYESVGQFLDDPDLFRVYLFTPQGMLAIDKCQTYLHGQELVATCPWSSREWKAMSAKYLARLREEGLTEADMVQCLAHYQAHRTAYYAVPFYSWKHLQNQHLSPIYDAELLIGLFEMYGRDVRHPVFLDRMAEISFDPINRAAMDEYLMSTVGKRYLDAIWLEVTNHLQKDPGGDDRLRCITDLFAEEDTVEWFVDGVFAKGSISVLSGKPKTGKTSLARHLIIGLSKGTSWLGCDIPQPVKVGYFCCDDPKPLFKHIMRLAYDHIGLPEAAFLPHVQFSLNPSLLLKTLKDAVAQGMEFFILDTLFDAVNVKSANDYAELKPIMGALNRFCRQHNVHILCIHHDRKGSRGTQDDILGSQAIAGSSSHNIAVYREDDNDETSSHCIRSSNRYPEFIGGTSFRGQEFVVTQTGCMLDAAHTPDQRKASKQVQLIVDIFGYVWAQRQPVSKADIERNVSGRVTVIREMVDDLVDKNILDRDGRKFVVHPRFAAETEETCNQALLAYLKGVEVPVFDASDGATSGQTGSRPEKRVP
jgi:hypothetical protein